MPNKENIYYQLLPSKKKPVSLTELVDKVRSAGVEAIDLQPAFRQAYEQDGEEMYLSDDTHWNAHAVAIATDQIANYLAK